MKMKLSSVFVAFLTFHKLLPVLYIRPRLFCFVLFSFALFHITISVCFCFSSSRFPSINCICHSPCPKSQQQLLTRKLATSNNTRNLQSGTNTWISDSYSFSQTLTLCPLVRVQVSFPLLGALCGIEREAKKMYADLSYLQSFPLFPGPELYPFQKLPYWSNVVQRTVSDYNLGGEGDLFKAPEPIMGEPTQGLDPLTFASMINNDRDIIAKSIKALDSVSTKTEHLLSETCTLSDHDIGGEDDLLHAPNSFVDESPPSVLHAPKSFTNEPPPSGYDPTSVAISKTSFTEDVISAPMIKASDINFFLSDHVPCEFFNECDESMVKSAAAESISKVSYTQNPAVIKEEPSAEEINGFAAGNLMQRSTSSGSLSTVEWMNCAAMRSNFLDFQTLNFGVDPGIRRAFSEGDIQTLRSGNSLGHSPFEKFSAVYASEDRKLRLSRYRIKKSRRNFSRKIKYACRKVLAENQLRVRGRFAKTEETGTSKTSSSDKCTTKRQLNDDCSASSCFNNAVQNEMLETSSPRLYQILESFYQGLASTSSVSAEMKLCWI